MSRLRSTLNALFESLQPKRRRMPFPQENRVNQVICTGISQITLGCCVFTLSLILSKREGDLGFIFQIGVPYWAALPIIITGVLGIAGGFTGQCTVAGMFLAASVISCFLGGILAACVGFALTERRSVGECEHVHCPYDTESILMIGLITILILQAAISLAGVIESSQILCCTVSEKDYLSVEAMGKTSQERRQSRARSERVNHNSSQIESSSYYSTEYEDPSDNTATKKCGFRNGRKSIRTSEIQTTV